MRIKLLIMVLFITLTSCDESNIKTDDTKQWNGADTLKVMFIGDSVIIENYKK